jgi:hypothetical protein
MTAPRSTLAKDSNQRGMIDLSAEANDTVQLQRRGASHAIKTMA